MTASCMSLEKRIGVPHLTRFESRPSVLGGDEHPIPHSSLHDFRSMDQDLHSSDARPPKLWWATDAEDTNREAPQCKVQDSLSADSVSQGDAEASFNPTGHVTRRQEGLIMARQPTTHRLRESVASEFRAIKSKARFRHRGEHRADAFQTASTASAASAAAPSTAPSVAPSSVPSLRGYEGSGRLPPLPQDLGSYISGLRQMPSPKPSFELQLTEEIITPRTVPVQRIRGVQAGRKHRGREDAAPAPALHEASVPELAELHRSMNLDMEQSGVQAQVARNAAASKRHQDEEGESARGSHHLRKTPSTVSFSLP